MCHRRLLLSVVQSASSSHRSHPSSSLSSTAYWFTDLSHHRRSLLLHNRTSVPYCFTIARAVQVPRQRGKVYLQTQSQDIKGKARSSFSISYIPLWFFVCFTWFGFVWWIFVVDLLFLSFPFSPFLVTSLQACGESSLCSSLSSAIGPVYPTRLNPFIIGLGRVRLRNKIRLDPTRLGLFSLVRFSFYLKPDPTRSVINPNIYDHKLQYWFMVNLSIPPCFLRNKRDEDVVIHAWAFQLKSTRSLSTCNLAALLHFWEEQESCIIDSLAKSFFTHNPL